MLSGKRVNSMAVDSDMSTQGEPGSAERVTARVVTYLRMLIDSGEIAAGGSAST